MCEYFVAINLIQTTFSTCRRELKRVQGKKSDFQSKSMKAILRFADLKYCGEKKILRNIIKRLLIRYWNVYFNFTLLSRILTIQEIYCFNLSAYSMVARKIIRPNTNMCCIKLQIHTNL